MAALRTGAGLVTVACPKSIQAVVASYAPELMTAGLKETEEGTISMEATGQLESLMTGKDVIVLGPGLSCHPETARFVRRLVVRCLQPLVLDADGLNAFEGHYHELKQHAETASFRVLTPHSGEAARLVGISANDIPADRLEVARRISRETGSCVVLKGRIELRAYLGVVSGVGAVQSGKNYGRLTCVKVWSLATGRRETRRAC